MSKTPILNIDEAEFTAWGRGERFEARLGALATRLGARKLGYRVVVLAPGKTAWPYHCHHVNEEMFFVLEGSGTLRHAGADYPLRRGDVVCCPPDPGAPHQIINTSSAELRYLAVSTMEEPELTQYPDSAKLGVVAGVAPGGDPGKMTVRAFFPKTGAVDYWEGEAP